MRRISFIVASLLALTTAVQPVRADTVEEFPVTGIPMSVAEGLDGNIWMTTFTFNQIARMTPTGNVNYFDVPGSTKPYDIVVAPDGNLWFTEGSGSHIGKITPAGVLTLIPVASTTVGIAVGPDGALWFTESSGNKIGRLPANATASTVPKEFPLPTANSQPWLITAGPDDAMWFAERNNGKIGRIPMTATPASPQIKEYAPGTTSITPIKTTTGPDGAIWFTDDTSSGDKRIGRIAVNATPGSNSQMTFFPVPEGSSPSHITSGSDGALWFTDSSAWVYRMTLSGLVTRYAFSTINTSTAGVSVTKNGDLLVAGSYGNVVARMSVTKTPHAWTSQSEGDFDGDGNQDVLWRSSSGALRIWYMGAAGVAKDWQFSGPNADWRIGGVGDFFGNQHDAILWQNTKDGRIMIYRFGARQVVSSKPTLPKKPTGWQIEQVADINHDTKADIVVRYATGLTEVWLMNGATITSTKALPTLP